MSYSPPPLYSAMVTTDPQTGLEVNSPLWMNWFLGLTQTVTTVTETINVYIPAGGSTPIAVNSGGGSSEGVVLEGDDSVSFMYPPGDTSNRTIAKGGTYYLDPALASYITWSSTNGLFYKPGPTSGSNADHTWTGSTGATEATLSAGSYVVQGNITATGALQGASGLITGNLVGQSIIQGQSLETTSGFVYLNGTASAYLGLDGTKGIIYHSGQFDGTYSHSWQNSGGGTLMTLTPKGALQVSGPIFGPGGNFWGNPGADGCDGEDGLMGPPGTGGTNGTNGATGQIGPTGAAGPLGMDGVDGEDGSMGPQGIPGTNGTNGSNGAQGATGPQGPAGVMGIPDIDYTDVASESLSVSPQQSNPIIAALNVTGIITPSTTSGIRGTTLADEANAGSIGEFKTVTLGPTAVTSAVTTNVGSTTLTAGDWEVVGVNNYVMTVGGVTFVYYGGTSTTSATLGPFGSYFQFQGQGSNILAIPPVRYNVSTSTTLYSVVNVSFGSGTCTVTSIVNMRRIR